MVHVTARPEAKITACLFENSCTMPAMFPAFWKHGEDGGSALEAMEVGGRVSCRMDAGWHPDQIQIDAAGVKMRRC